MDWELVKAVPVFVKVPEIKKTWSTKARPRTMVIKKTKTESEKWIEMWTEFGPQTT